MYQVSYKCLMSLYFPHYEVLMAGETVRQRQAVWSSASQTCLCTGITWGYYQMCLLMQQCCGGV